MLELPILLVLIALVVWFLRGSKAVILENPLIVSQAGQYHITLSPQLTCAQGFIESIATDFLPLKAQMGNVPTQYFTVYDSNETAARAGYLLAVSLRRGVLYFQAIIGVQTNNNVREIQQFSEAVLVSQPLGDRPDEAGATRLVAVVIATAKKLNIEISLLSFT